MIDTHEMDVSGLSRDWNPADVDLDRISIDELGDDGYGQLVREGLEQRVDRLR
ncbi:MAG: hypothetical protein H7Y15_01345 [Pseudonocardia sp.]|nr:hypothetical protein [Pseudonocardia sp.]